MAETDLPGFDECNYALKSAAGVNSLSSQLALVAHSLHLCLPQLYAHRQGLETSTHSVSSPQTSHCYRATALQPQPPFSSGLWNSPCNPNDIGWICGKKRWAYTHMCSTLIQYNTTTHAHSEKSTHVASGCNLCFFLEVLCKNSGITITPNSSHTHQHTWSAWWWSSRPQQRKSPRTYINYWNVNIWISLSF